MQKNYRNLLYHCIKIALAAVLAIAVAGELGLKNSATAGIITILSIRSTKKETLQSALNRLLAFGCALLVAGACFGVLGFTLPAFAVYLFLFALICMRLGWAEAISADSVLVSHFLAARSMSPSWVGNELLLLVIGAGIGILVNLHLHRRRDVFDKVAEEVDGQIKGVLHRMSIWLLTEDRSEYNANCFGRLRESVSEAGRCAADNYNNRFLNADETELAYVSLRERQVVVLQEVYENIKALSGTPRQAEAIAELLRHIEEHFGRDATAMEAAKGAEGTAEASLKGPDSCTDTELCIRALHRLFADMKKEPLPESREEFEDRAILFHILKLLERFLEMQQ